MIAITVRLLPKLVLLMTGVAAVPLVLAGANAIRISQNVTRDQVRDAHRQLAGNLASAVQDTMDDVEGTLTNAGRTFPFAKMSPDEQVAALRVLFYQMPSVDTLALVSPEGRPLVTPVGLSAADKVNASESLKSRSTRDDDSVLRFLVRVPLVADGKPKASPLYETGEARGPFVALAVPAAGGALAAEVSLSRVRAELSGFTIGKRGRAFLVDGAGKIAVHEDAAQQGRDLTTDPFFGAQLSNLLPAAGEWQDPDGSRWIGAYAPILNLGWGVVVAQPEQDAFIASRSLLGQTLIWVSASLAAAIALAFFYAREVGGPVLDAAKGANRLAQGDLSHRIQKRTDDEVGTLVDAFNDMATKLQASMKELEEWNATLQVKVEERTRELREAQAQLVQQKKLAALGELGAGVAHELNNPLAGIKGFAQLLLLSRKPEDKEYKQIKTIEDQAKRCSEIVSRLLRFSQEATTGSRQKVELNAVVVEALTLFDQQLKEQKIELEMKLTEGLPAIAGTPGELREVCWHVLSNAKNAMPQGGKITVASWADENLVKISFTDSGKGIAAEIIERIFEPFFTTKDAWRGTGLGLSVVHRIVTDHAGTIAVQSEPGKGSTFVFSFPILGEGQVIAPQPEAEKQRVKTQLV